MILGGKSCKKWSQKLQKMDVKWNQNGPDQTLPRLCSVNLGNRRSIPTTSNCAFGCEMCYLRCFEQLIPVSPGQSMIPRFVQLVVLAGLILFIPSFLYLSHAPHQLVIDPNTGLTYSSDSILKANGPGQVNPLAQISQGQGVDSSQVPNAGWTWKGVEQNMGIGVHKVEDKLKGFVDGWRPAAASSLSTLHTLSSASSTSPTFASGAANSMISAAAKPKDTIRVEGVAMPKMANATAKAALGKSTWHFLHTMTLRFPDKPTLQESETLRSFFANFAQLYPCGDCAHHFQQLVKELPPQVGSRMSASLWLCAVHNEVNKSLGKPEFPCDKLDESYDCGCGDDSESVMASSRFPAPALPTPSL